MKKFAVIGTSCSGKTTVVYNIVGRLRKEGYHIEGLTSTDRVYPFKQSKLDTLEQAQQYVILQQALLEVTIECRSDVTSFISDRSVIDFFAYYLYCFPNNSLEKDVIEEFCIGWANTYEKIFYVKPLPFVDDGKRPNDEFRMNVDKIIDDLTKVINQVKLIKGEPNEREEKIYKEIRKDIQK